MPKWMPCNGSFVAGDVIRWREPVWGRRRAGKKKAPPIGEMLIVAQVVECGAEWVWLSLQSSKTKNAETWWKKIPELKEGATLKRQRATLSKRNAERRSWGGKDGESARTLAASRFLG